jgi:hypothetical protein
MPARCFFLVDQLGLQKKASAGTGACTCFLLESWASLLVFLTALE